MARALGTLPRLAQALARGELSYAKVRALTRVATPETEEQLLAVGKACTADHVERIVRGWRCVDRQAEARETARRHRSRALHVYQDEDGMVVVRGRLAPEVGGAVLVQALAAAREALYQRAHTENSVTDAINKNVSAETFPAPRVSAIRSSSTSTCRCWPIRTRPASPSSRTARTFLPKRPSAWRAMRPEW